MILISAVVFVFLPRIASVELLFSEDVTVLSSVKNNLKRLDIKEGRWLSSELLCPVDWYRCTKASRFFLPPPSG
jgi:hypothetical protein